MHASSILVVDDEEIVRESMTADLRAAGYEVVPCESGEAAFRAMCQRTYDLVITDLVMEGADGFAVLTEARRRDPLTMVIVLTGYATLPTAVEALRLGASDYLQKPYDRAELGLRVAACLERQALAEKVRLYERILPLCMDCRMVRDDSGREPGTGAWVTVEEYLRKRAKVEVSHGLCPACFAARGGRRRGREV